MGSVRQAFDRHAPAYDRVFAARGVREEVWEIADSCFSAGMRVLDLGCGTGEDALHFAARGMDVTAIDVSPGMIAELSRKAGGAVRYEVADMQDYAATAGPFDAVFSNFGALNCVSDLNWLGRLRLIPGAHLVLTTMGRFYPLESAVFLLKGRPRMAFRRFGRSPEAAVEGVRFNVYYHSVRSIRRSLGSNFELKRVHGLRSVSPAPGFEHLERFGALRLLEPLDRWLCRQRLSASWADHFVSVWRYREA